MDNELSLALAWACTATLATLYYMRKASYFKDICDASMLTFKALAEGNATIKRTKDGITVRGKDD